MRYWIYIHTCPNGKKYVGITTQKTPELRWGSKGRKYEYNKHFYSAILKYGWDNITHELFEVESEEEMYRKEVELISFYHSNDPRYGYNNSTGGELSARGCKHSEESREKTSNALKGRKKSEEHRRKLSEANKGKHLSEETRKKISETLKEIPHPWNKGKKHKSPSEETRRKISEAKKVKKGPLKRESNEALSIRRILEE